VVLIGTSKAVSSGFARTAAGPPKLTMGPDVMVNVASVGKVFTTIAVLKSAAPPRFSITYVQRQVFANRPLCRHHPL
jgi:hypothetical protein